MDRCSLVYPYSRDHDFVARSLEVIEQCLDREDVSNDIRKICVGFNGGKDCTVLLVLVTAVLQKRNLLSQEESLKLKCLNVSNSKDTFPEMEHFVQSCNRQFNLSMYKLPGSIKEALFTLKKRDDQIQAIYMGTRLSDFKPDSGSKNENPTHFQLTDEGWPRFLRVSPILGWSYHEVWKFLRDLNIPYCSLYDEGYTSIGSMDDTRKNPRLRTASLSSHLPAWELQDSGDEREGRL